MMPIEELKQYLPKYLSEDSYKALIAELHSFPYNIDKRMYTTSLPSDVLFQGDGYDSFPVIDLMHLDKGCKSSYGIIMSNTCDIDVKNIRLYPSSIMYAPIISLEKYRSVLEKRNVEKEKIDNHLTKIREQAITSILYLPSNGKIQDSIVFIDKMLHIGNDYVNRKTLGQHRLFSLSNYGFYLLLFKLSVHFSRIQEKVDRRHSEYV